MKRINRREALRAGTIAALGSQMLAQPNCALGRAPQSKIGGLIKHGRLKQSVCRWCYRSTPDDVFYRAVAELAVARGRDPDAPPHLRKVTETI